MSATLRAPQTVYVKVSTDLLAELSEWSEPLHVRVERQPDDTFEMVFRRPEGVHDA